MGLGNSRCGVSVDTAAEFRDYDNIQECIQTGGNSRCGHSRRISARLTLTLCYCMGLTFHLLYAVLVLKGSDSEIFFRI